MSDGELVRQTLAGRVAAYEELVRRWAHRVSAVCHAKTGRQGMVEDLAQESFLRAYRALASLLNPERFGAWICGIAVRTCLDWLKSKERSQVNFSELAPDRNPESFLARQGNPGSQAIENAEEAANLMAEVERLPEKFRQVLMFFYYDDMAYRDIAELLKVSPATVNARLTKARALLRSRMKKSRS